MKPGTDGRPTGAGQLEPAGRNDRTFRCDPTLLHLIPAHFGPCAPQRGAVRYLNVTTISIGCLTDHDPFIS